MKLFVQKMAVLGLLLVLAISGLNYLGIKAGKVYKDGAALVCETKRDMVRSGSIHYETGKTNVLFMGTSRILAGINPIAFDEYSGGNTFSYNLALPALPISAAYFVLRDYLAKNPPPQVIVMQLYINRCRTCTLVNYYSSQGMTRLDEMLSLFANSPGKGIVVNYVFPFRMYKFFTVQYLFNGMLHPARLQEAREFNKTILDGMKKERGYYFIQEQALSQDNRLPAGGFGEDGNESNETPKLEKNTEYDPFLDPYVEKFFNLTEEKDIHVLLIQPVYRENQCMQYEQIPLQFQVLLARYRHVATAAQGWKVKLYENSFFADPTHLNREGALRFTREIYNEFHEVFGEKEIRAGMEIIHEH